MYNFVSNRPDEDTLELIKRTGDSNQAIAYRAQKEFAKAVEIPLREVILSGNILDGLFTPLVLEPGGSVEYPLDVIAPGDEDEFVAYTSPGNGRIAEKQVEGDRVMVPTFMVENAIDWLLKYAREARWDIVQRCLQILNFGFIKKMNDDGWHTILSAAADRNILVYDADASAGQFTKRLVSLAKVNMRRNGGGNSTSVNRRRLTHIAISPEGLEDIRNWGLDQVDEMTRREIYLADDSSDRVTKIFGAILIDLDELGVGQQYTNFWTGDLAATVQTSDTELAIALDLTRGNFVMPIRQEVEIHPDPWLHRSHKEGYYGTADYGVGVMSSTDVMALSF